jgi:hypothetical protein
MRAVRSAGSALIIRFASPGVRPEDRHPARDRWREAARLDIPTQASIGLMRVTIQDLLSIPSAMKENSKNGTFS